MQTTDRSEFARALTVMAEIFGFTLTAEQLEVWWRLFATWTLAEFRSAADHLLSHNKFMPRPADFQSLRNQAGQRTAGEAWAEVLAFVRSGGYCGGCRLGDELTHRAVLAIGGYEAVAMSPTESTPFLERRFAEHYATMQDASAARQALPDEAPELTMEPARRRMDGPHRLLGSDND